MNTSSLGTPQLGLCMMYPSPGVIERIGADWDWIWIDAQHGEIGYSEILQMVRACDLIGRPAYVRVPAQETGWVGKVLDTGAKGVIVPLVESVAEAAAMVQAAKFPPVGNRSYGGRRPIDRKGREYALTANQETELLVQIESPNAARLAGEIAALEGVDGLFLGMDDYVIRQGLTADAPKTWETVGEAFQLAGDACRKHGKRLCAVGVGEGLLRLCLQGGCDMIVGGGEVGFLAAGSKAAREAADRFIACKENAARPGAGGGGLY